MTITKIYIDNISDIDAILYSGPRWGGILTNIFEFRPQKKPINLGTVTNQKDDYYKGK